MTALAVGVALLTLYLQAHLDDDAPPPPGVSS